MFLWSNHSGTGTHTLLVAETNDALLKNAVEAGAEKIISLLPSNILDDSLYLLFEWHPSRAQLSASVTDASKKHDAPQQIMCEFSGVRDTLLRLDSRQREQQQIDLTERIKYWLHDYLTTSTAFFKFSLVAIFHADSRANSELL